MRLARYAANAPAATSVQPRFFTSLLMPLTATPAAFAGSENPQKLPCSATYSGVSTFPEPQVRPPGVDPGSSYSYHVLIELPQARMLRNIVPLCSVPCTFPEVMQSSDYSIPRMPSRRRDRANPSAAINSFPEFT